MSIWGFEEPVLKKVWFEKRFTPYPHYIVHDFEAIVAPLNENPTDDLRYFSSHKAISVAIHDTLGKEPAYLVDKNPKSMTGRFIKVLTEKQEAIVEDVLK